MKEKIVTEKAPAPGGKYSQAIRMGDIVFLSGQLPLKPDTLTLDEESPQSMYRQCFNNLKAVCEAAGGNLQRIVKLNVYYTDMYYSQFIDEVIPEFFEEPYPARIRLVVKEISKGAKVEIDGIMCL
jgi:2-iminobutanoate/2-iminopropanoate deaminase